MSFHCVRQTHTVVRHVIKWLLFDIVKAAICWLSQWFCFSEAGSEDRQRQSHNVGCCNVVIASWLPITQIKVRYSKELLTPVIVRTYCKSSLFSAAVSSNGHWMKTIWMRNSSNLQGQPMFFEWSLNCLEYWLMSQIIWTLL